MTDEELYLFDTLGYLKTENVLDRETVSAGLAAAQRIVDDHPELLEEAGYGDKYRRVIMYEKILERIAYSPAVMSYVCHVTNNMPRLTDATLMVQNAAHGFHNFHLRKDIDSEIREDAPRFYTDAVNRRIYSDYVTFFVYLTEVREGDGGLLVVPGSHRASFIYPPELFYESGAHPVAAEEREKAGFVNVTVNAGDMIIMPLRLNHAALPWLPRDRERVMMFYTYKPQFYCCESMDETLEFARSNDIELDAETIELAAMKEKGQMKEIVKKYADVG